MIKWEYRKILLNMQSDSCEETMNKLGQMEWELVSSIPVMDPFAYHFFKRAIHETQQSVIDKQKIESL